MEEEEEDQTKHRLILEMSREELALLLFLYVSFVWSSQQTFKQEKVRRKGTNN